MKTQSILKTALITAGFSAMAFISSAQAQIVNVDINDSSNPASGTYSGQGALSDAGNNFWNALNVGNQTGNNYTVSGLTASNGSTSTLISFNLNSTGISSIMNAFDSTPAVPSATAPALLNDFAYGYDEGNGINMNFTVGGLVSGDKYDIYLYTGAGGYYSASATFTIGATSLSASNGGAPAAGFVAGNNYVEFTNVIADGSGNITGVDSAGALGNNYISGLQIDNVTPAAPEPSTYALMGLGALALLVVSRRRRTV